MGGGELVGDGVLVGGVGLEFVVVLVVVVVVVAVGGGGGWWWRGWGWWWCQLGVALFVLDLVVVVGHDFGVGVVCVGCGGDEAVVEDPRRGAFGAFYFGHCACFGVGIAVVRPGM